MRPDDLHPLVGCVVFLFLLGSSSAATNATNATATPEPSAGTLLRLSFVIDGVVYVMQCNFSGLNMSNCTFATDHGLTVSPLSGSAGGSTDIPVYMVAIMIATLVLVAVLVGLAAYLVWSRNTGRTSQGYAPMEQPPQYQQNPGPQYQQNPGPQYYTEPGAYSGAMARAGGRPKIISVNLVQPCLPPDATMA